MSGTLSYCLVLFMLIYPLMCKLDDGFENKFTEKFSEELIDYDIEDGPWSVLPYGLPFRNMDELCPHSDICSTKLGYAVDESGSPCCMGCSCESDCGLTQNCCFPELDLYEIPGPDEDFSSCVYPVTQVYAENLPIHSYIMIDRCPSERECDICGDKVVAEWGSLHPVYSNKTGQIYKNQKCAECYNITDGQIWEPFQIINLKEDLLRLPTGGHLLASKLEDRNNMVVRFVPPEGVNLNRHACFAEIINSCEHDYSYRIFANLTDHQICKSGLNAPYFFDGKYYSNIFCAICIMDFRTFWKETRKCTRQSAEPAGDFLVSIDKEFTFKYGVSETKEACNFKGKKCKDVFCPIGHTRINGSCALFHSKWFYKNLQLVLEFNPKTENDRFTVYRLEYIDVSISVPPETKWLQKKIIIEQGDTSNILRVYVEMLWKQTNTDHVTTAEIIESVFRLIEKSKCNIRYTVSSFTYDAGISRYAYFDEINHHPLWRVIKQSTNLQGGPGSFETQTKMIKVYSNNAVRTGLGVPVSINQLFFCEQVELKHREFITYFNGTQIYEKETGKTYQDGEFLLIEQKPGKQIARICLKDSGYYVIENKNGGCEMAIEKHFILILVCGGFLLNPNFSTKILTFSHN